MAGQPPETDPGEGPTRFSVLVIAGTAITLALAAPLLKRQLGRFLLVHGSFRILGAALGAAAALAILTWAIHRFPKATALFLGGLAVVLAALSGNLVALAEACAIFVVVFLLGDAVSRAVRGRDPALEDWAATFAAGVAATGLGVLVLAEAGLLRPGVVAAAGAAIVLLRRRRALAYAALARELPGFVAGSSRRSLEAFWTAIVAAALAVAWLKILGPDVSWDALGYHLPEARDIAESGRTAILPDLFPQSLLWHNQENFLGLGFFFRNGERVISFLNFGFGLAGFGAALALARRVGGGAPRALVLLALAGFPLVLYQLHTTSVDWATAALVASAAAELAASGNEPRRAFLGGLLFGAAVVAKPFAILAAPALAFLAIRRVGWRPRRLAAVAGLALLPVLPWMAWSWRHFGTPLGPLSYPGTHVVSLPGGRLVRTAERVPDPPPALVPARRPLPSVARILRLPYDIAFRSGRVGAYRDGYFGVLAFLLGLGVLGWPWRIGALFAVSALAVLVAWSLLPESSVRYLLPAYPLYAVFLVVGLSRGTHAFSGKLGIIAGLALAVALLAVAPQFALKSREVKLACGLRTREQVLSEELPARALWSLVSPRDRAVLIGEYDRFHCPAGLAYRTRFLPVVRWGDDPEVWRRELRRYGITVVVFSPVPGPMPLPLRVPELERSGDLQVVARNGTTTLYRVSAKP